LEIEQPNDNEDSDMKVLLSSGYGAGWGTWNPEFPDCDTDAGLIALVEAGEYKAAERYAVDKWEGIYTGCLHTCWVKEVPSGATFQIREDDGRESLVVFRPKFWRVAT
jgi:hypothetical protein